jgi:hypothetical protein
MKYGDLLLLVLGLVVIMSIGYTIGVNTSIWYIPLILAIFFVFMVYELKIKK